MDPLFDQSAFACSRQITRLYSTSFSLGIRSLAKAYHEPIYGIYGFVRYADEIVDTYQGQERAELLAKFREDTFCAIRKELSLNPVLHAYQLVVNRYNIPDELTEAFLESMAMDLQMDAHSESSYHQYIYGSAEAVGLMCLCVFCDGDRHYYETLKPAARALGAAFQKVNFLRDFCSDYQDRGRIYFPGTDFQHFDREAKQAIEADIEQDFLAAKAGIARLPRGAKLGVYLTYIYYYRLFRKISQLPPEEIQSRRVRIPNFHKICLLLGTYLRYQLRIIS